MLLISQHSMPPRFLGPLLLVRLFVPPHDSKTLLPADNCGRLRDRDQHECYQLLLHVSSKLERLQVLMPDCSLQIFVGFAVPIVRDTATFQWNKLIADTKAVSVTLTNLSLPVAELHCI